MSLTDFFTLPLGLDLTDAFSNPERLHNADQVQPELDHFQSQRFTHSRARSSVSFGGVKASRLNQGPVTLHLDPCCTRHQAEHARLGSDRQNTLSRLTTRR